MTVAVFLTLFAVPVVYGLLARSTRSPQHVSRLVDRLMGKNAEARFNFIQARASALSDDEIDA